MWPGGVENLSESSDSPISTTKIQLRIVNTNEQSLIQKLRKTLCNFELTLHGEISRRKTEKKSRGFVTPVQILTEPDSK